MEFWDRFKNDLTMDYLMDGMSHDDAENNCLQQIGGYLAAQGSGLGCFGLREPEFRPREIQLEFEAFAHCLNRLKEQSTEDLERMNPDQAGIYDCILRDAYGEGPHQVYYVEGKAGRGKSFLVNTICSTLRSQSYIVIITGTTSLSVTLYERGRTAHSTFGNSSQTISVASLSSCAHPDRPRPYGRTDRNSKG